MNLEPQNYLALLTSIIRTDPSLVGRIKEILNSYMQLEPYEDLLKDIDVHLQAHLRYVLNDINEIDSPTEMEKEVQVLVNHLDSLEDDLSVDGIPADEIGEAPEGEEEPGSGKKKKAKAAGKSKKKAAAKKAPARKKAKPAARKKASKKKPARRPPKKKKLRPAKRLKPKKRVPAKKKKVKSKAKAPARKKKASKKK